MLTASGSSAVPLPMSHTPAPCEKSSDGTPPSYGEEYTRGRRPHTHFASRRERERRVVKMKPGWNGGLRG